MSQDTLFNNKMSHEEIRRATEKFLNKGGSVKKLPKQHVVSYTNIGGEKWGAYESVRNLSF